MQPRLAFLFPGQGSQYTGMLGPLRGVVPGFAERLEALDAVWHALEGESLVARVFRAPSAEHDADLTRTRNAQPAIGLVSIALARALDDELGLRPAFAAGHSYGELPALAFAGAFDDPSLLRLSRERGRLLDEAGEQVGGSMLAVMAPPEHAASLIASTGGVLAIATLNEPRQVVISGETEAVESAQQRASLRGIQTARLRTSCGFHSPLMRPAAALWRAVLDNTTLAPPARLAVVSTVSARPYTSQTEMRDLLARQLVEPVRWVDAIESLYEQGARVFVEVGPGHALTDLAERILSDRPHLALALDPGRRDARQHITRAFAQLEEYGIPTRQVLAPSHQSDVVLAFLETNRRVLEAFFAKQQRVIGLAADATPTERLELFTALVEANQRTVADYLETQERALTRLPGGPAAPTVPPPTPQGDSSASAAPRLASEACEAEEPGTEAWLGRTIAELTGFPREVIRRDTEFERELGLDSITMIELYCRLSQRFTDLEQHVDRLRSAKTVGELVELLEALAKPDDNPAASAAAEPPPARASGGTAARQLRAEIVALIEQLRGDAAASIDDGHDVELDQALDVFAREQLTAWLVEAHPDLAVAGRELLHTPTLDTLIELCGRILGDRPEAPATNRPLQEPLGRFVRLEAPVPEALPGALPREVLLIGPRGRAADRFRRALEERGHEVTSLALSLAGWDLPGATALTPLEDVEGLACGLRPLLDQDRAYAVLFLALDGKRDLGWDAFSGRVERSATGLFVLAKALVTLSRPVWLGIAAVGGSDGAWAGARGVARALVREWPGVTVRAVWIEGGASIAVDRVLDALAAAGSDLDLVLRGDRLLRQEIEARPPRVTTGDSIRLGPNSLMVLLGGGDGITAEAAHAVAVRYGCRIAVIGRTPFPDTPPFEDIEDGPALRQAVVDALERETGEAQGEELWSRFHLVSRQRALWRTRRRVEAMGATFAYAQADATRAEELARALDEIRVAHGPIHAVVHGAGLTEDGLVASKSVESFRRVLYAKAHSVFHLRALLRDDPLQVVLLFSSLAAHAGTAGQTDYVAANEILEALGREWNAQVAYPVRSIRWSVWTEAGLASTALRQQMARLGLAGIGNHAGTSHFLEELARGGKDDECVLVAPPSTLAFASRPEPEQVQTRSSCNAEL